MRYRASDPMRGLRATNPNENKDKNPMKKLMITFSAALIAGICAADIQSSNIVG